MAIQLRDQSHCKYDQISLGEVMLRLDPGEGDLPLTLQAEYLEILDDKIICHKTLIVDTEVVLMPEEAEMEILVEKEVVVEKIPESTTIS
jgi:hypothetical protein